MDARIRAGWITEEDLAAASEEESEAGAPEAVDTNPSVSA